MRVGERGGPELEVHLEIQFSTLEGAISNGKELETRG